jgi:glycosyltransferase involved in cell wall biosynthesis
VTIARAGLLAGVARLRRCRVIMHAHGGRLELWLGRGRGRSLFVRVSLTAVNDVVAVSGGGRAALARALGGRRVHLVDNAVDPSSFMGERAPVGPPRVLYAGGLTPRKGVLDLLAASMMLRTRGVEHEVVLAGGTPDEGPEAEARVRRAAGDAAASLLGSVPHEQMPSVYRSADVFCLPSWWEAMPLSVLEAMAAGLPVVATAVGDLARIVEHGVAGLIVPPRRPDLLADALAELLSDPALGVEMGRAGRERVVRQFSIDGLVASLAGLYGTPTDSAR